MLFEEKQSIKYPKFISHRGYTPIAPENSLISFEEAGKRGVWAIETDVRMTRDGGMVCCHDSSTARRFGEELIIEETDLDDLMKLRISAGNHVGAYPSDCLRMPKLDEYLDICARYGAVPFIETKGTADVVEAVLRELKRRGIISKSVVSSIEFEHIEQARRLNSEVFVHHIFSSEALLPKLSKMNNAGLSYNYTNLDEVPEGLIERTHEAGVKVCLRAGDDVGTAVKMIEMGLDYIPTNTMYRIDI